MDDMNIMNREMKKRQLRRQIVPGPAQQPSLVPEGGEEEEEIKKAHRKVIRK